MAEKKIVNLVEKKEPIDSDILIVEDATATKKITWANLIKPVKDMLGNLANLTTSVKTSIVAAANEIKGNVGDLSSLTTSAKNNIVAAANEIKGNVGDLSSLTTSAKNNIVAAINEVQERASSFSSYSLKRSVNNGFTSIPASTLGVDNPTKYTWFVSIPYGGGIFTGVPQAAANALVVYIRKTDGSIVGNGDYDVWLIRVKK